MISFEYSKEVFMGLCSMLFFFREDSLSDFRSDMDDVNFSENRLCDFSGIAELRGYSRGDIFRSTAMVWRPACFLVFSIL